MSRKVGTSWKRQREQESQVPAERRLSRRADAGGTAGRTGKVDAGWERQEEQGELMPAGSGRNEQVW